MNMMKHGFFLVALFLVSGMLSGCATIVSGSTQLVNVQVIDEKTHDLVSNAKCEIVDPKGIYYVINNNPGSASLPREYGGLTVRCHAPGYWQKSIGAGSSFNAWAIGDILFWPGAIVDAATAAAKKYPSHITVLMSTHFVRHPQTRIKVK